MGAKKEPDPNDPLLAAPAAHETAGVLRMQRAGIPGPEIMRMLNLRGTELMKQLQRGLDQETIAHQRGLPIYDERMPKGTE